MQRSPELEERFRRFWQQLDAGNSGVIDELCSRHECVRGFGTDEAEDWMGYAELSRTWKAQRDEVAGLEAEARHTIEDIHAWAERGVGWVAVKSRAVRSDGRDLLMRSTYVFRLEQGEWRFVHIHSSAGIPNEELWGHRTLTSIDLMTLSLEHESPLLHPVAGPDGTATILFTDIEDSTRLNERLGDEQWMGMLRHHNAIIRKHVAAENGLEVKHQGDGFMLVFADPAGAARSAVAIQRSLTHPAGSERIRVRIGAHAGPTILESDDFFGRTVAMAARIAGAARGGEILVSDAVRAGLGGAGFTFGESLGLKLKGFRERQTVHRIEWVSA